MDDGSDIDIKLNLVQGSDATEAVENTVAEVGKAADTSADKAEKLLKVISDLVGKLDGMDTEAAKKLRDELLELAKVVNTLDMTRLEHLDNILESLAATGAKLTGDGVKEITDKLKEATEEAKAFKDSFSNDADVKVNVTFNAEDSLADLKERIDATEEANKLIATLQKVRKEIGKIDDEVKASELETAITVMEASFKNLDPSNAEKGVRAFEKLTKVVSGLSEKQRSVLKSFDFSKAETQVTGLANKIIATAPKAAEETDKIGMVADLLQGKFDAVGNSILELIQKTKLWAKELTKAGTVKAGAAIAVFAVGVKKAVEVLNAYIEKQIADYKEHLDSLRQGFQEQAKIAEEMWEYGNKARERESKKAEIRRNEELAKQTGVAEMEKANIKQLAQRQLATTVDPAERERITREETRKIEDIDYDLQKKNIDATEEQLNRQIADKEKSLEALKKAQKSVADASRMTSEQLNKLANGEDGYWAEAINSITKKYGFDSVDEITKSQEALKALMDQQKKLAEQKKDLEIEIEEAKRSRTQIIDNPRAKIEQDRMVQLASRDTEDAERRRGYELENMDRDRELSERARENREADYDAMREYEDSMRTFEGRMESLTELIDMREKEREEAQKKLNALMDRNVGKEEQEWSRKDKKLRGWYEADVQRLTGTLRQLRSSRLSALREGDTEGVSFRRGRLEERRAVEEQDRAILNQWREQIGGNIGQEAVARSEVARRQAQVDASKKEQADIEAQVTKRLLKEGRVKPGEKVNFEDERYNKMMTRSERAKYDNARGDVRQYTSELKSAAQKNAELQMNRMERQGEFKENMWKNSNRLTAMGLGGGNGIVGDFGKETADNTREANQILKDILGALETDGKGGMGGGIVWGM